MSEYNCLYDWLESCKLAIYMDNFVQGGFDMTSMAGLTAEDLTAINIVKTGHRKKLLSESNKLKVPGDVFPQERPEDIMTWLRLIHLDQYTPQFIDNGFDDMDFVQDITIEDLVSIGITKPGHQRKIWLAVNALGLTCPENGGIDKIPVADNGKPPSIQGYLETDLDLVEEKRIKEREGMEILNTDIDSALSRLPADGASDVAGTFEDVGIEHERMRNEEDHEQLSKKALDRDIASLQIDSLNDTRGSTPNLDSILDSLDKDSGLSPEKKTEKSLNQPGQERRSSGPFQMSFTRRSRSSSKDRMSAESGIQSRSSFDNRPVSAEATDTGSNIRSSQEAAPSAAGLEQDERSKPANKEPDFIRARHNTMESKSTVPVGESSGFDQRARGTSFDSMTANKRPPPPVKPKSFKKPPPIAPKPTGSTAKARLEHQVAKKEAAVKDNSEVEPTDAQSTERNLSTGSSPKKAPLSILPKTRHGSVHSQSTSSEDSIEAVLEDLETRNRYDDRRKSFEKLRRRFTDPENCGSEGSGHEDEISEVRMRCDSQQELQEQIKDVFRRRSQENILVEQDQLESLNQETHVSKEDIDTDEELLKDQQYTEDLMKDINSMLSDFSTEIDTMFDDQADKSTSV